MPFRPSLAPAPAPAPPQPVVWQTEQMADKPAPKPAPLTPGRPAPDFTATDSSGETVSLADFRGRRVVLYFYPKDDTPGCTKQACNLRDNLGRLTDHDIAIIGISPDDDTSHQRFSAKYQLPFPLVADPDREIIEAYGVWGARTNYGRTFMGLQRTTFLIDAQGNIEHVFKRPKVAEHADEILARFA